MSDKPLRLATVSGWGTKDLQIVTKAIAVLFVTISFTQENSSFEHDAQPVATQPLLIYFYFPKKPASSSRLVSFSLPVNKNSQLMALGKLDHHSPAIHRPKLPGPF